MDDFTTFSFTHLDRERTVYRKGTGPAVLVMHEVPGIPGEVAHFARRVVDAGFTVFMPHLFGPVGVRTSPFNRIPQLVKVFITTPGVWEPGYGFPALSAMPGEFLAKDLVLLGASLWTAGEAWRASWR